MKLRPDLLLSLLLATAACGDSGGPDLSGSAYVTASLDGSAWTADTTFGIFFGLTPDSGSLVFGGARIVGDQEEDLTIAFRGVPGTGTFTLADTTAPAIGLFSVIYLNAGFPPPMDTWQSSPLFPGTLRITGWNPTDSIVAGTFAFEAATDPDTAAHRTLSGQFRVRYTFQQVFIP